MNQRIALVVAAGITTFVLVVVGGLVTRFAQSNAVPAAPAVVQTDAPSAASPQLDPGVQSVIQQRETAYQQTVQQANQQLQEAYQQQQALKEQLAQAQAAAAQSAPAAAQSAPAVAAGPISREQAIQAAVNYLGGGTVTQVEEENEHGMAVYGVGFADGSEVYVDQASGEVAYARVRSSRHEYEEHEDH